MSKKFLIGSAILLFLALLLLWGHSKAKKLMAVFDKMTIDPDRVSNIDIALNRIKFNLSVLLTNPTNDDFFISGLGAADLQRINVFYDGKFLATAPVIISEIDIPANNQLVIENIQVEVPKPLDFVANNLALVYSMISNFDINKVMVTGVLDVLGNQIEISK